jgi:Domain of unknown function (DUF5134)
MPDMAEPRWLAALVAALMLVIAAYCAVRLVAARFWRRRVDVVADVNHLLMGVAMAGMLIPRLAVLPAAPWEGVFAAGCAWYAWQAVRGRAGAGARARAGRWPCSPPVPHLVANAAMIYMLAAAPTPAGTGTAGPMPGMAGSAAGARYPVLALLFAVFLVGYVAWVGDRLTSMNPAAISPVAGAAVAATGPAAGTAAGPGLVLAPRASACCQIAMGLAMGYALITML